MSAARIRPHGQMRQSQIVTQFGPGAIIDLPKHAVIVGGLDSWSKPKGQIFEDRLVAKLKIALNVNSLELYPPPIDLGENPTPGFGISVFQFPEWFIVQKDEPKVGKESFVRSRMLIHREHLERGRYRRERRLETVVPMRYVQACVHGHISDIEWRVFVHGRQDSCARRLYVDERGTGGDLSDLTIRCDCGRSQQLIIAKQQPGFLGHCAGHRPWLGMRARQNCNELNRILLRSASNAYFPQPLSAISIPDLSGPIRRAIDSVWEDFLQYAESPDDIRRERRKDRVKDALAGFTDDDVYAEVLRRRIGTPDTAKTIKQAEFETLVASPDESGQDVLDSDFHARVCSLEDKSDFAPMIDKVVLVHRLREVLAQVGFTRFEAASPDVEGELTLGVRRADLANEISWLPAIENKGEGIFFSLRKDKIEAWAQRPAIRKRGETLLRGFGRWDAEHQWSKNKFPGLPYIMLHSLSHLLITAISLECGYSASSIRERIYAGPYGYGILLMTGTAGSEGTLGGLVEVGRRLFDHLRNALASGSLCSNDPVCAQHQPDHAHEQRYLHGAACHGCLLIAETSCERFNQFLDRALVIPTVENLGAEFFCEGSNG